ncbi:MAG: TetR/AcrR family transcriptional regulator [Acidiphilium sp.]|nr:TetR/AcrR family transcriptional regulator [Acidiphilium sp.]MDD4936318.1 TetR/AcrR family transcriptional regulator [Acidiphilium sp.]
MSKSLSAPVLKRATTPATSPQARILDVARELFCRDGIHATGIDRILAEAGASKMTLYARYGSKDALLRAVLVEEGEDWRQRFFTRLDAAGPEPLAQLQAIVPALSDWFSGGKFYGCAFMNAVSEHRKDEVWLRAMAADHHREILAKLNAIGTAAGIADPGTLARQMLLLMDGTIAALMVSGDATVLDIAKRNLDAILAAAPYIDPAY